MKEILKRFEKYYNKESKAIRRREKLMETWLELNPSTTKRLHIQRCVDIETKRMEDIKKLICMMKEYCKKPSRKLDKEIEEFADFILGINQEHYDILINIAKKEMEQT